MRVRFCSQIRGLRSPANLHPSLVKKAKLQPETDCDGRVKLLLAGFELWELRNLFPDGYVR